MVEDMGIIIENIPNKDAMIYLCLNENYIKEIKNIQYLKNLKQLHLNFNLIEKIDIGVSKINTLKQFWICDNKIKIIENIPDNYDVEFHNGNTNVPLSDTVEIDVSCERILFKS